MKCVLYLLYADQNLISNSNTKQIKSFVFYDRKQREDRNSIYCMQKKELITYMVSMTAQGSVVRWERRQWCTSWERPTLHWRNVLRLQATTRLSPLIKLEITGLKADSVIRATIIPIKTEYQSNEWAERGGVGAV